MQSANFIDDVGFGDPLDFHVPWLGHLVCCPEVSAEAFRVGAFIALSMDDTERRVWAGRPADIAYETDLTADVVEHSVFQLANKGCLFTCQSGDMIECALNFDFNEWAR